MTEEILSSGEIDRIEVRGNVDVAKIAAKYEDTGSIFTAISSMVTGSNEETADQSDKKEATSDKKEPESDEFFSSLGNVFSKKEESGAEKE